MPIHNPVNTNFLETGVLDGIHIMGEYWCDHLNTPTELGELISAAKDHSSPAAQTQLQTKIADCARSVSATSALRSLNRNDILVIPATHAADSTSGLVPRLAASVANAMGVTCCEALTRRNPANNLRNTPVQQRLEVVKTAGYEVNTSVCDRFVVLVDDVVLTGTTLNYLAGLLKQQGAATVTALVVARTRLGAHNPNVLDRAY